MSDKQKRVNAIGLSGELVYPVSGTVIKKKDDVVAQLVEALVNSEDLITGYLDTFAKLGDRMPYGHRVLSEVQSALAAAKEAGL